MPPSQLTVYPANRVEDLALLLEHVLRLSPAGVLAPATVVVESKGMQHWLSMTLAASSGLCMNIDYPMPGGFVWRLVRSVLGAERVPQESPYRREAMVWRIDRLLASPTCLDDPRFEAVNRYWQGTDGQAEDPLKRFQLATKQADLFEQYLLYRPDWISAWDSGQVPDALTDNWQGALWRLLTDEQPDHPVRLQQQAVAALAQAKQKLPSQVCLFAINTLPPSTLQFFDQLARYTQVHLFHLNPCVAYWGDLQSDKQLAAQRAEQVRRWLAQADPEQPDCAVGASELGETGNPLLANLGSQGKEFFAALQGLQSTEISAFDLPDQHPEGLGTAVTLLQQVQRDILQLRDPRPVDADQPPPVQVDSSITISASHSALRELQALHDWLLHRFNEDPTLSPRDVLVMCPQVEQYAPYIGAVFATHTTAAEPGDAPRLPVSITDRAPRDAEPLVSSFLELLTLPDSRFQVSKVLDLLRLPALQARFGFGAEELDTLSWWLQEACVHWGLDAAHKAQTLSVTEGSELFSWSWGLRRLLLGFARSDQAQLVDNQWLLPHVEGSDALLLGRLMQLLERLAQHARLLARARTPAQWGGYLRQLREAFFAETGDEERDAGDAVEQAVHQLVSWTDRVNYQQPLTLAVVRDYLSRHLATPDDSNRFMTGQVTFCSLEPMRSAPFRLIAILGLNDGEYPRQQIPFGFDLMAETPRRAGDRSRRGDDRYLFLEALICARDKLYLSYQGADIKNNSERQPSLILSELMDYLQRGYGWRFDAKTPDCQLQVQPLHPFSPANFSGSAPSFDQRWLGLVAPQAERDNCIELPLEADAEPAVLELEALVTFLTNPARSFAEHRLGLHFETGRSALDDAEPFDADGLAAFQGRELLLAAGLSKDPAAQRAEVEQMLRVSGHLPDSRRADATLAQWATAAELLASAVREQQGVQRVNQPFSLTLDGVELRGELPLVCPQGESLLLLWRPASLKAKDKLRLWLYHLCAQAAGVANTSRALYLTEDRDKQPLAESLTLERVSAPEVQLTQLISCWRQGNIQPLLLNADLGFAVCEAQYKSNKGAWTPKPDPDNAREACWLQQWQPNPFTGGYGAGQDPYVRWFWPEGDALDRWWPQLAAIYQPATAAMLGLNAEEDTP